MNSLIDPHHSGFLMGHSTNDPITRLESDIRTSLIEYKIHITVFLDIKQAFDAVWHFGLLRKIKDMELNGNLAAFLQDFITNRRISVRSNNTTSNIYPVRQGVPQGSAISPTLFLIMINDICKECQNISYSLFADDCAIW
jgi:hypothetical protein